MRMYGWLVRVLAIAAMLLFVGCGDDNTAGPFQNSSLVDAGPIGTVDNGPGDCVPLCHSKTCGTDGCGGSCGDCIDLCTGQPNTSALCQDGECTQNCATLEVALSYASEVGYETLNVNYYTTGSCPSAGSLPNGSALSATDAGQPKSVTLGGSKKTSSGRIVVLGHGPAANRGWGCVDGVQL
ncbi:MAG: hypothetical protein ACI9WU_001793, partial [Myxococcota bacterium]